MLWSWGSPYHIIVIALEFTKATVPHESLPTSIILAPWTHCVHTQLRLLGGHLPWSKPPDHLQLLILSILGCISYPCETSLFLNTSYISGLTHITPIVSKLAYKPLGIHIGFYVILWYSLTHSKTVIPLRWRLGTLWSANHLFSSCLRWEHHLWRWLGWMIIWPLIIKVIHCRIFNIDSHFTCLILMGILCWKVNWFLLWNFEMTAEVLHFKFL